LGPLKEAGWESGGKKGSVGGGPKISNRKKKKPGPW